MTGIRILLVLGLLPLLAAQARAGDESSTSGGEAGPKGPRALNRVFNGRVVKIKKKRVTLFYDFEDQVQLKDFEDARPPRLLDASQNRVRIEGGRLVLEGSSSIRHKMEGTGELRGHFFVRISDQGNIGTVFTEPILSDFFVCMTLFDQRFYKNGAFFLCACGLHEDEGADTDMALVNWRDIFAGNVKNKVKVGEDAEVEVYKDGWTEYARCEDVEGKGSSKGKCKDMRTYQFGLWVHNARASFDDLTISIELTDKFLDLNNLKAELDAEWEDIPQTGPLAGIGGVPTRFRSAIDAYAEGATADVRLIVKALATKSIPDRGREVAAEVLMARKDPKAVPTAIDGLYSEDVMTRKLTIGVIKSIVGKDFGYTATGSPKKRSEAIQKLNAHLALERAKYYG